MKVKVLKPFIDIHTKTQYKAGAVIEMDEKRLKEAAAAFSRQLKKRPLPSLQQEGRRRRTADGR